MIKCLWMSKILNLIKSNILYIAWAQALLATTGSLYYSEILRVVPCLLCWYQRIFMYPLVIIIAVGILRKDKNLPYYVLPMSLAGGTIALYHYLLQFGVIPESSVPCIAGVSCASRYIEYFGFVTIPFLSLVSFVIVLVSMFIHLKESKK